MALLRGQPFCFWGQPHKEGEGSYPPERSPRPCLARTQLGGCFPGRRAGLPRARRGQAAAPAASRAEAGGSQRQRRGSPAGQRRSARRPPPHTPPAAPAHLSSDRLSASSFLPPSLPQRLLLAARRPWARRSGVARRCPSLSRRQLPLSLHPHIPPAAAATAAAAAPKFTALRRHEVILPAPSPGRRTPLPPRRGRWPLRPAARAPRGPGAPPPPEGSALRRLYTHPAAPEAGRGGSVPGRHGCGPGLPPGHGCRMGRSAPRQPCPLGSPLSGLWGARCSRPEAGGPRPAPTAAPLTVSVTQASPPCPTRSYRAKRRGTGEGGLPQRCKAGAKGEPPSGRALCVCACPCFEGKSAVILVAVCGRPALPPPLSASGHASAPQPVPLKKCTSFWGGGEFLCQWLLLGAGEGRAEERHCVQGHRDTILPCQGRPDIFKIHQ